MEVKVKLDGGMMPTKGSKFAAAYDLYCPEDYVLKTGRQVVDLGFAVELPHGYAAIVQPRSGFSVKGVEVKRYNINGAEANLMTDSYRMDADVIVGLVDEDFRGHVGVVMKVHRYIYSNELFVIPKGTRIAQMRIVHVPDTELEVVDELDMTNDRGGGFGHTGTV